MLVTPLQGELANLVSLMTRSQRERELGFLGVLYPPAEVGLGARWQTAVDLRPTLSDSEPARTEIRGGLLSVTYELLTVGKKAGKDAAEIRVATSGQWIVIRNGVDPAQGDKFRVTASGILWVELANGVPLESQSETTYEADRRDVAYRTVTKATLSRVEEGDAAPAREKKAAAKG